MKEFGLIIKLGISIACVMFFGHLIPLDLQRAFFTFSILLKETLIFCMPVIVLAYIVSCLASFQRKAHLLIVMILTIVTISNFFFTQVGYFAGSIGLPLLGYHAKVVAQEFATGPSLEPFFRVPYPHIVSTDMALLIAAVVGLYGAFWGTERFAAWAEALKNKVQYSLTKIFIPLVPLYVVGFLFKIQHDASLAEMFAGYGPMIGLIVIVQAASVFFFYLKANLGNFQNIKISLKNAFPSGLVAFSTMSSAATMPLTLAAAEKNTRNKALAQVVIPATANIHHVGDSVAIPILMAVVYAMNGFDPMNFSTFLYFSMFYMIAKYAVASVPGGEMIVLLPILEAHFSYTDAMSGLLTTLYIFCDPFITTTSVLSNGALAILMDRICGRMRAFQEITEGVS